jgi:uncharacterized protein with HEPN domain
MQHEAVNNRLFISDMLEAVQYIQNFSANQTFDSFSKSILIQSAVIRQFEIIGEAASRVSENFKTVHFTINWRAVKEFRNLLIHEYHRVDIGILWATMESNIPALKEQL